MNIFVCCVTDAREESSLEFAMMLVALPSVLPPGASMRVYFMPDVQVGPEAFLETSPGPNDLFVAMDTMVSSLDFVKGALLQAGSDEGPDFVLGVVPEPHIDWHSVEQGLPPYGTQFDSIISGQGGDYIKLADADKPVSLPRAFWTRARALQQQPNLWPRPGGSSVHIDAAHQLTIMGKHAFTGCVGNRVVHVTPGADRNGTPALGRKMHGAEDKPASY